VRKRLGLAHIATVGKLYWTLFESLPKVRGRSKSPIPPLLPLYTVRTLPTLLTLLQVLTEESKAGLVEDILAWSKLATFGLQ
jgi:hypothetical protein